MKYYSQIDPEYCNEELVPGVTIKEYGCFFCCICTLAQIHPLELLKLCKEFRYCFTTNGLLYPGKVGSLAGTPYLGVFDGNEPDEACITYLVDYRHKKTETHFVVRLNNGRFFDPLTGYNLTKNSLIEHYYGWELVNYRLFDNVKISDWIEETRKEGIELGITNGERMKEPMIRAEGVKMILNLYNKLKK